MPFSPTLRWSAGTQNKLPRRERHVNAFLRSVLAGASVVAALVPYYARTAVRAQERPLVLGFHHVHMNVVDPERSAAFYVTNFQSKRVTVAGWDGVQTE